MRSEKEIRERLNQERKEFVDTYPHIDLEGKFSQGFIKALEWVLEED